VTLSTLTDRERADYQLLGGAKVIIGWLLDKPGPDSEAYAREWLAEYEKQMQPIVIVEPKAEL
jgi:hypothetical protein